MKFMNELYEWILQGQLYATGQWTFQGQILPMSGIRPHIITALRVMLELFFSAQFDSNGQRLFFWLEVAVKRQEKWPISLLSEAFENLQ